MPDYSEMQRQADQRSAPAEPTGVKPGGGGGGEPPKRTAKVIPFRVISDEDNPPEEREHLARHLLPDVEVQDDCVVSRRKDGWLLRSDPCALKVCGRSSPAEREDDQAESADAANDSATDAHSPQVVVVDEDNPLLAAALDYARRGWPVLPLHSTCDSACTCGKAGCDRPGKHPLGRLVPRGVKDATTDANTIRAWWQAAPFANIGIATGGVSGIVALDVDPARGGKDSLDALEREHRTLPETVTSATGGGGEHRLLKHPGGAIGNRVNLAPGLDVRGDGGYVVAPPSLHASGRKYQWAIRPDVKARLI